MMIYVVRDVFFTSGADELKRKREIDIIKK